MASRRMPAVGQRFNMVGQRFNMVGQRFNMVGQRFNAMRFTRCVANALGVSEDRVAALSYDEGVTASRRTSS